MSGEKLSVWKDPDVIGALRSGRHPDDICVLNCRQCGQLSYYNQGSSFYCKHCEVSWCVATEDEIEYLQIEGRPYIMVDEFLTMADVSDAECEDY